jgi:hypothetical protein
MDVLYAERRSMRMDFRIVLWTLAAVVLKRPVAVHRGSGRMNVRRRPVHELQAVPVPVPVPVPVAVAVPEQS